MASDTTFCFKGTENFYIENGIFKGYDEPYLTEYTNYGELIVERLKSRPDFVSQIDAITGKEETLAMMLEKSVKCAIWLKEQNVKPGDTIAICTHIQMDMYIPCYAALFIGAVIKPWWDFRLTNDVTKHLLDLMAPKIVFVDEASAAMTSRVAKEMGVKTKIVVIGNASGFQSLEDVLSSVDDELVPEFQCTKLASVDEPALIFLTSGTTGMPKGALHGHRCLFGNVIVRDLHCSDKDVTIAMNYSKLPWVSGIITMLRAAAGLERRIIYPTFDEEKTLQLIEKTVIRCNDKNVTVGWFHTGDLVHYDEEGHVYVKDRMEEIIKFRGQYASPTMIEQLLQTHPGVRENAVLGVPHDTDGEHPIAFVAKVPSMEVTKDELEQMVSEAVPDDMKLRGGVMFLNELPHTSSGKVNRSQLRKLAESYGA